MSDSRFAVEGKASLNFTKTSVDNSVEQLACDHDGLETVPIESDMRRISSLRR